MPAVLFVCTANQCRSPMAEAMFRRLLEEHGLTGWRVESAGTWTQDGIPATNFAQEAMRARGLDISAHRSREVSADLLRQFDLILTMEEGHKEALRFEFPDVADRVFLLSEMADKAFEIEDPVGKPLEEYRRTADEIHALLKAGLDRICERVNAGNVRAED